MQEFFTRQKANEGKKIPLYLPDGKPSDHWLVVRGVDSDHFKQAETRGKRQAITIAKIEGADERAQAIRDTELTCIAALVADWSFDQECTEPNVVNFLREAPQIADMVNQVAAKRASFFA
ncbi:Tail assembly chaperone [Vibrio phage K251 g3]